MTDEPTDGGGVEGTTELGAGGVEQPDKVEVHYIKSNFFRVVTADGAWGGFAPNASHLVLHFYNERSPIPQLHLLGIGKDGTLGPVLETRGRTGIVREVEVAVTIDVPRARELASWLNSRLDLYDRLIASSKETQP